MPKLRRKNIFKPRKVTRIPEGEDPPDSSCDVNLIGERGIRYDQGVSNSIFYGYIIGIILWILLVIFFCISSIKINALGYVILFIPIVIFAIGAYNSNKITYDVEDSVFNADYLSLGLIITLPLLAWVSKDYPGDRTWLITIAILAIVLSLFSMIDIWVTRRWMSVVKHSKSILQTMSLILIIYALYVYYLSKPQNISQH
jgi:hypothetical protein